MTRHDGVFPRSLAAIGALPGIGRSTAAAIAAFAYGTRAAILDGNVKRVLARHRGVEGFPGEARVARALWSIAEAALPERDIEHYTQAMMDLGAGICLRNRPRCEACPVAQDCMARSEGRIDGLPAPRPVRTLPTRAVRMLVLQCEDRVLLERRAETGVWGGLVEPAGSRPGGRFARGVRGPLRSGCAARRAARAHRAWLHPFPPHHPSRAHRRRGRAGRDGGAGTCLGPSRCRRGARRAGAGAAPAPAPARGGNANGRVQRGGSMSLSRGGRSASRSG